MDEKQKVTAESSESESKDGGFGAFAVCNTFNDTVHCLKLLEAFKYLCSSDTLFCKVRLVQFFAQSACIQFTIMWF